MRLCLATGLALFLFMNCKNEAAGQVSAKLMSDGSVHSLMQTKLILQNKLPIVKELYFKVVFSLNDGGESEAVLSNTFLIEPGNLEFSLLDLFPNLLIPSSSKLMCLYIYDAESQMAIINSCVNIKNSPQNIDNLLERPKGNFTMEAGFYNNSTVAAIQGKFGSGFYGVPLSISGYYATPNNNELIKINNNLTLEFDRKKWKEKMTDFASEKINAEKVKLLKSVPINFEQATKKVEYYDKIISSSSQSIDVASVKNMAAVFGLDESLDMQSIQSQLDQLTKVKNGSIDVPKSKVNDSLNLYYLKYKNLSEDKRQVFLDSIHDRIEKLESLKLFKRKQEVINSIEEKKDSILRQTEKYRHKYEVYKKYEKQILNNPKEIHTFAKESPKYQKFYKYIHYLSAFKAGNISLPQSRLLLNTGRIKGVQAEIKYAGVTMGGFYGKLTQFVLPNRDTIISYFDRNSITLAGGHIKIEYDEKSSSKFMYIKNTGASQLTNNPSAILGQASVFSMPNGALLSFETYWAINNIVKNAEELNSNSSIIKDMAITSAYNWNIQKVQYKFEMDYYGLGYRQFSRATQLNNLIRSRASIKYTISKSLRIGGNAFISRNNLWEQIGPSFVSKNIGSDITFKTTSGSNILYFINRTLINGDGFSGRNTIHGLSNSSKFKFNTISFTSQINILSSYMKGSRDTMNYNSISCFSFLKADFTKQSNINTTFQLSALQGLNSNKQIVFTLQYGYSYKQKLFINTGGKILQDEGVTYLNFIGEINYSYKELNMELQIDPLNLKQFYVSDGTNTNLFQPATKMVATYKF